MSDDPDWGGGERRQATVLFADLSGYTRLNERLDPEEVESIMDKIKREALRIVEYHGGTVARFIGDEVMALFGIPSAHEDDAARAIRAALQLHDAVRQMSPGLETRVGGALTMHSGINSGLLVVTTSDELEGLDGPYAVTGNTINVGARLRSLAAPDEILISPSTQRLVMPYFKTQALKAVSAKGIAEPMIPYLVLGFSKVHSRFEAARDRGFTSFTGRAEELATLHACVEKTVQGAGHFVTVEGDAGAGKSRLLFEFKHDIDRDKITVLEARCQSYGSDNPYLPFIDGMRHGLELEDEDTEAELLHKAVTSIGRYGPPVEDYLPFYLHLLNIKSEYSLPENIQGNELRKAMQESICALITLSAKNRPLILILEDWHWRDEASDAVLRHLFTSLADHPITIIISYRAEHQMEWPQRDDHTRILLPPLDSSHTEGITKSAFKASELPKGLCALIHDRAGGNPLFIEEACYTLLESNAVQVNNGRAVLNQDLETLTLPDSVQAIIRTRLDRLGIEAKEVVRLASVVGRAFSQRILERLYSTRLSLSDQLETLISQELIRQTRLPPEAEYTFKHAIVWEVAYETLLLKQRKDLHTIIGRAMEELYPDRLDERAAILAYHYARGERSDKAIYYAILAGDQAARLYANTEATTYYEQALKLAQSLDPSAKVHKQQIDAVIKLAATDTPRKDIGRDHKNLEQARTLAISLNDEYRLAQILYWLGRVHYVLAELKPAIEYAKQSLEIADRLEDDELGAAPVSLMARTYWQLSEFAKAAEISERSIRQMRRVANKTEEATASGFIGALYSYLGEFERALSYADNSIRLAQEIRNPFAEAANYHYRGIIRDQIGMWTHAISDYEKSRHIANKAGDIFRVYITMFMEGRARTFSGETTRGLQLLNESVSLAGKIGTKFLLGQAKSYLAACLVARGESDGVDGLCREAIALTEEAGDRFSSAIAHRTLAESLCVFGADNLDEAEAAALLAIKILKGIKARPELGRSYVCYARLLKRRGDDAKSQVFLSRAAKLFASIDMHADLAEVSVVPNQ